jgi:hypothetical protein
MRGYVTWFLGLTLVAQLIHASNGWHASYVAMLAAHNAEMANELKGSLNLWTLALIFGSISLVLFLILARAVRKDLEKAVRPLESPRKGGPGEGGSLAPPQT